MPYHYVGFHNPVSPIYFLLYTALALLIIGCAASSEVMASTLTAKKVWLQEIGFRV
jgi:hypothetical protein